MSMIPCPGCGLPREEELVGAVPCPLCMAAPAPPPATHSPAAKPTTPDPTAGLPADAGELHRHAAGGGFTVPRWFPWAAVFSVGLATGITSVLAWQAAFPPGSPQPDTAAASNDSRLPAFPQRIPVAPMPHLAPPASLSQGGQEPTPEPKLDPAIPAGLRVVTIPLDQPEGEYVLPARLEKIEKVILRGRVKKFTVTGLTAGVVVDASELKAAGVAIGGRIDGRAVLKVNSPGGLVNVSAIISGKATVEIAAPGGVVEFNPPNAAAAQIDGGSVMTITARETELRGEVNGIETTVTVNLPSNGVLRVAAVRGIATVQYRVTDNRGTPLVTTGPVSPTANFRKIE